MEEAFGVAPVNKGEGGSIPFIPELQRIFPKAQVLVTGPEDPKANAHSPNESISLPALKNNVITERCCWISSPSKKPCKACRNRIKLSVIRFRLERMTESFFI